MWIFCGAVGVNIESGKVSFKQFPFCHNFVTVFHLLSLPIQNSFVGKRPTRSGLALPVADTEKNLINALSRPAIQKFESGVLIRISIVPVEARIVQSFERAVRTVTDNDYRLGRISKFSARFFQKVVQPRTVDLATEHFLLGRIGVLRNFQYPLDFFSDVVFREYNDLYTTITVKVNKAVAQSSLAYATDATKNDMKKNHHEKILCQ